MTQKTDPDLILTEWARRWLAGCEELADLTAPELREELQRARVLVLALLAAVETADPGAATRAALRAVRDGSATEEQRRLADASNRARAAIGLPPAWPDDDVGASDPSGAGRR